MTQSQVVGSGAVSRRTFLRMTGGGTVGLAFLLAACNPASQAVPTPATAGAPPAPVGATAAVTGQPTTAAAATAAPTAPSSATAKPAAAVAGRSPLPAYVAAVSAKPDLPPSDTGLQAGYFTYPKDLVKSVSQAPGLGGDVVAMTQTTVALPPPVEQNAAWQAVNKALNANMKMQLVSSTDYRTRVATTMAGSDLPDLLFLNFQESIAGIPQFLKAQYADLTPYLAGDAIKEYPNLAAFPTSAWKQTLLDGSIFSVPVVRPYLDWTWFANQNLMTEIGATQPQNADDFKRLLKDLTRPQSGQYGFGSVAPAYGLLLAGRGDAPQAAMFGVPNNWAVDGNGAFKKDFETEGFRAALGYFRDLYSEGVFYPDPLNSTTLRNNLLAGKYGIIVTGWASYPSLLWDGGATQNPPVQIRALAPFSHDGSRPIWHQFQGLNGQTAVRKGSPERVKELLRILNYLAAPFGSEEYHLLNFGQTGTDHTFDAKGNPILTKTGQADTAVGWNRLLTSMPVLFNGNDEEFVKVSYADAQKMVPYLQTDPSLGLYSATDSMRGGVVTNKFADGLGDVVTGRQPLSYLDQMLNEWRSGGGDQMRSEFQQAYAAAKA